MDFLNENPATKNYFDVKIDARFIFYIENNIL